MGFQNPMGHYESYLYIHCGSSRKKEKEIERISEEIVAEKIPKFLKIHASRKTRSSKNSTSFKPRNPH